MEAAEKKAIAVCVGVLGEAFRQKVSDVTIRAYEIGLDGMSAAAINHAVERAIRECRWMPVPAELRAFAQEYLRRIQPRQIERAHPFRAPQLCTPEERTEARKFLADCIAAIGRMPAAKEPLRISDSTKR